MWHIPDRLESLDARSPWLSGPPSRREVLSLHAFAAACCFWTLSVQPSLARAADAETAKPFPPGAVAVYDGGAITVTEVREAMRNPALLKSDPSLTRNDRVNLESLVQYLAIRKILLSEADHLNLDQRPEYRLDLKFLPEQVLTQMMLDELRAKAEELAPTDAEVRAHFEQNRADYLSVESIVGRRIVIDRAKHGEAAAGLRAKEALLAVRSGTSFTQAAQKYSDVPVPANPQPYPARTWTNENVILLVQAGDGRISDVLTTEQAYEIVEVSRLGVAEDFDLQRVLHYIREMMIQAHYYRWLEELRTKAEEDFPVQCGEEVDVSDLDPETLKSLIAVPTLPTTQPANAASADAGGEVTAADNADSAPPSEPTTQPALDYTALNESEPFEGTKKAAALLAAFEFATMTSGAPMPPPAEPDKPAIRCGRFILTRLEMQALMHYRGLPRDADCTETVRFLIDQLYGHPHYSGMELPIAQFVRRLGYDRRPEFAARLLLRIEEHRAEYAKRALIPFWRRTMSVDEDTLRDHYDREWTETVSPMLDYDILIVPAPFDPNETDYQHQQKLAQAYEAATRIIARAMSGASLEDIAAANPSFQFLPEQRRVVNDDSPLQDLVATLGPGDVAASPYEDFDGWCVIRVREYQPRQKTPYEMARRYVLDSFQQEYEDDFRSGFESAFLKRINFQFDARAAQALGIEQGELR